jgi:type IV pilus assembly protein PilM
VQFRDLPEGVISVSPARDNILMPDVLAMHVSALAPAQRPTRETPARGPDPARSFSARAGSRLRLVSHAADEQHSLVRFRVKKTVPFDIESAVVSYHVQPREAGRQDRSSRSRHGARNRGPLRSGVPLRRLRARIRHHLRAGRVEPAARHRAEPSGEVERNVLSAMAVNGTRFKLIRTIELEDVNREDILGILYPTLAYLEDEMLSKVDRVLLCGFGGITQPLATEWESELGIPVTALQSKRGSPGQFNAGLLGYLEAGETRREDTGQSRQRTVPPGPPDADRIGDRRRGSHGPAARPHLDHPVRSRPRLGNP